MRVRVVPMGWSWSVYLISEAQKTMVEAAVPAPLLLDKIPLPQISHSGAPLADKGMGRHKDTIVAAAFLYIDNFGIISCSVQAARSHFSDIGSELDRRGVLHTSDPEGTNKLIGFELVRQGTRWRPSADKLRRCLLYTSPSPRDS